MLHHPSYEKLAELKLTGRQAALAEQAEREDISQMPFMDRLACCSIVRSWPERTVSSPAGYAGPSCATPRPASRTSTGGVSERFRQDWSGSPRARHGLSPLQIFRLRRPSLSGVCGRPHSCNTSHT